MLQVLSEHTFSQYDVVQGRTMWKFFFYETNQVEVGGHVMPETGEGKGVITSVQNMTTSSS